MSDLMTLSADDQRTTALHVLTQVIEETTSDPEGGTYIACAVIEVMRATELILQLGEGTFELMLEEFHGRLEQFVKTPGSIVSLSGYRFCVVLKDLTSNDHLELATVKLKRLLSPPVSVVNHSVLVQTNAGFALIRAKDAQPSTLLQAAESALQRCTPAQRYVVYDPEAVAGEANGWTIKVEIEEALNKGELVPYFEPVTNTAFGTVTAGYATLAWNSPKRGLQPFAKLVEAANDCEMLRPVYWMYIKGAIGQASKWSDLVGLILPLPDQLLIDDEVVQQIEDALEIYSLKPSRLTVEVQESVLMTPLGRSLLESLRQRKILVRIASVGDGGLPLAQIGMLPADEIAFSRHMLSKNIPPALRTLIFEMFKRANLKLVATGVKEPRLIQRFKDLGFQTVQGSGVGEIQPYDQFANWLRQKAGS